MRRFGADNPYRDLQPFCSGDPLDWRCRSATKETRETVVDLMKGGISPLDAAALFWWTRNLLYFDQRLGDDQRIRILRYERACTGSAEVIQALAEYVGIPLPQHSIASKVHQQHGASSVVELNPEVERLCRTLWDSFVGYPEL